MSGAVARKRCDPAKKWTVKRDTFEAEFAPFPSERRGRFAHPQTLSKKWGIGSRIGRTFTSDPEHQFSELPTPSEKPGPGSRNARKFT